MVQRINQVCDVFAEVAVDIVGLLKQLRRLVDQICSEDIVEKTFLIGFVELIQAVGEQTKVAQMKILAALRFFSSMATSRTLSPEEIMSSMITMFFPSTFEPRTHGLRLGSGR